MDGVGKASIDNNSSVSRSTPSLLGHARSATVRCRPSVRSRRGEEAEWPEYVVVSNLRVIVERATCGSRSLHLVMMLLLLLLAITTLADQGGHTAVFPLLPPVLFPFLLFPLLPLLYSFPICPLPFPLPLPSFSIPPLPGPGPQLILTIRLLITRLVTTDLVILRVY